MLVLVLVFGISGVRSAGAGAGVGVDEITANDYK